MGREPWGVTGQIHSIASMRDALEAVRVASGSLWSKLTCPACGEHLGEAPVQSHVCGHTLCAGCGYQARTKLGKCPVSVCGMPARPLDLTDDRTVRDVVSAAKQLHEATKASTAVASISNRDEVKRVCVTGLGDPRLCEAVVGELRGLGAELADFRGGTSATVVVTPVDRDTRDFAARTRSVHYALACDLPVVDVAWVRACVSRGHWLPTKPYEAARPQREGNSVFGGVCATVACGADLLAHDVRCWLQTAGATLLDNDQPLPSGNVRMFVRIVPDLAVGEDEDEDCSISDTRTAECEEKGVMADVRDVPWVSDCLVSQACPPAIQFLETMQDDESDCQ